MSYGAGSVRKNGEELPLRQERKVSEDPRYFKAYKSPSLLFKHDLNSFNKVKNDLWLENEKCYKEMKKLYPKSVPEKINFLVFHKMKERYKEKLDVLIGKKKAKAVKSKKNKWSDVDLSRKIQSVIDWENVEWFRSEELILSREKSKGKCKRESAVGDVSEEEKKMEIIKAIVPLKNEIHKEKEKILNLKQINY